MADETQTDDVPLDDATAADTAQDTATAAEPSVAELAAEMGWSPKEQWRGAPDKWKPAAEFLKTTVDINRTQSRELKAMKAQVDRIASTSAAIVEQQVAERVAAAEAKFTAAVEAGDPNAARAATREIDQLKAAAPAADPEAQFAAANPWYGKDEDATALAIGVSNRLAAQGATVEAQLDAAAAAVAKTFPHLAGGAKPAAKAPPAVNAPTSRTAAPSNRAKGVSDLPPSARKAGEMFVAKGLVPSLDAYAKVWLSENAA